jgi:hypothetical protein
MATNISKAVAQIKGSLASVLPSDVIVMLCQRLDYKWRKRCLDPVTTLHAFLMQILHGNTACDHVPHLMGQKFSGAAYCMARSKLPLELFQRLIQAVCGVFQTVCKSSQWRGHRVWLLDGSSCSMPDTKELQKAFGQPGGQKKGCGFPVAHLLTLFDFSTGLLLRVNAAPLRTHDMSQVKRVHCEMRKGDVLLADRGFCSYGHLALLFLAGIHGVFRMHQRMIVSFRKGRPHRSLQAQRRRQRKKGKKGLPTSRWVRWLGKVDQVVEYFKPRQRPTWMTAKAYAALPNSLLLRELRYRISQKGYRTREVVLVTSLLNPRKYSSQDLADLYGRRWQVETNLRHLKQTLGMDTLHTKTLKNVLKELTMFVLAYNLVRLVMLNAAEQQNVPVDRISFIDALRWLRDNKRDAPFIPLIVVPQRLGRAEPRVRKRRPKEFPPMSKPRNQYRKCQATSKLTA